MATIHDHPELRIRTRSGWSGSWTTVPYAAALEIQRRAQPSLSTATIQYRYGSIKREDQTSFADYEPLALVGRFIAIESSTDGGGNWSRRFTGYVPAEQFQLHADRSGQAAGVQILTAVDLSYLLQQRRVIQSMIANYGSSSPQAIGRTLPMNRRDRMGLSAFGNRSDVQYERGGFGTSYVFGEAREVWTARQFVEYLLTWYAEDVPFTLRGQLQMLDAFTPVGVNFENHTVLDALNMLIPRKRGMTWSIEIENDDVFVDVRTTLVQQISEGGVTLPANDRQLGIDLDNDDVLDPTYEVKTAAYYDRIIVRGAPVRSVFTVDAFAGQLEKLWSDVQETDYQTADDDRRQDDADFGDVYAAFRLAGNRLDDALNANPSINELGIVVESTQAAIRDWGLSFLPVLPIPVPLTIDSGGGAEPEPRYLRPFAVILDRRNSSEKWRFCHRLNEVELNSARIELIDGQPAFRLVSAVNHQFGRNHFTGKSRSEKTNALDYTDLMATLAIETDEVLRYELSGLGGDSRAVLTIDVPDAELWWVAPGTVLGIDENAELITQDNGETTRDDSDRLKNIAALAKAWYGRTRATLSFTWPYITTAPNIGSLIVAAQNAGYASPVNTPVTGVIEDLVRFRTTIITDYEELDFTAIL